MTLRHSLALLLFLSAVNLALMIPGGFVENRTFADYPVAVLVGFNIFLTILGIGSLILAYRVYGSGVNSLLPVLAGLAFVIVYGIDLAAIFPVTATPMSPRLESLEWIGTILGAAVIGSGLLATRSGPPSDDAIRLPGWLKVLIGAAGLLIVAFATWSALGSS